MRSSRSASSRITIVARAGTGFTMAGFDLRASTSHGFLNPGMLRGCGERLEVLKFAVAVALIGLGGCWAGYWTYSAAGGGNEAAMGEQHDVAFGANDAFVMTEDVLRGEGILFDVFPDHKIVTLWKPADTPASMFASLVGVEPRYRYEIEVVPNGPRRSRIVVNVRAEDIADNELPDYQATKRLDLFNKVDQLASRFPPPSTTPREGGVNYALLPNEDLRGLAKRVTGSEANWQQIAKDNGLTSPTDIGGIQSVWVRNTLLPASKKTSASATH
jgi:hypothetical protein